MDDLDAINITDMETADLEALLDKLTSLNDEEITVEQMLLEDEIRIELDWRDA